MAPKGGDMELQKSPCDRIEVVDTSVAAEQDRVEDLESYERVDVYVGEEEEVDKTTNRSNKTRCFLRPEIMPVADYIATGCAVNPPDKN